jgi:hypothetical protein
MTSPRKQKSKRPPSRQGPGRGRPSEYTDEIADAISLRIADGESLRLICKDPRMPDRSTVFRWLASKREFRDQYARAREAQADILFDEILEIADNTNGDVIEVKQADGSTMVRANHANVHRARLQVDARKWVASKLAPKKYGDHATVLAPGFDEDGKPLRPTLIINRYPLTKEEEAAQARETEAERRRLEQQH